MNTNKCLLFVFAIALATLMNPVSMVLAQDAASSVDPGMEAALADLNQLLGDQTAGDDTVSEELNGLRQKLAQLDATLSSRDNELQTLSESLSEAEARIRNLTDENQILKSEIENQHRRVEKAQEAERQAKADFERLFQEETKTTNDHETENARQAAEIERLKGELANARSAVRSLEEKLEEARAPLAQSSSSDTLNADTAELQATINELRDVDTQRKAAMDELFKQLAAQKKNVSAREQQISELTAELEATKTTVQDRDRELGLRDNAINVERDKVAELQKKISALDDALAESRRQIEGSSATLSNRELELQAMRDELEQVKLVDVQRRKTLDETLNSLATAEKRVNTLSQDLDQTRSELTAKVDQLTVQVATLTSRNATLESEIARMEQDVLAAQAKRDEALDKVSGLEDLISARDTRIVDLEAQVSRLTAVDTQRRKAMDQVLLDTATLEQEKARLELEVQQLKQDLANKDVSEVQVADSDSAVVEQLQKQNSTLQQRVNELEDALQQARETGAPAVSNVSNNDRNDSLDSGARSDWQSEKQQLQEKLRELRNAAAEDASEMERLTRELSKAQQDALELETRVKTLEGRKNDVRESDLFKELEQVNALMREKMLEVEADRQRLSKLVKTSEQQDSQQIKTIEEQGQRLAELETALAEAGERETEYQELIERLTPKIETLEQEVSKLADEREMLQNKLVLRDEDVKALKVELERREHRLAKAERVADVLEKARTEVLRAGEREKLNMHYNMASVYAREGKFEEAENEYLQALRIDPTDADVHYNLGILYDDEMKQPEKAMVHYRRYLQLNPHGPDADRVRTWLMKLEMKTQR